MSQGINIDEGGTLCGNATSGLVNGINNAKENKNLASVFQKTKQQLELRKKFLRRIGVEDEREFFLGENPSGKINFVDTIGNYSFSQKMASHEFSQESLRKYSFFSEFSLRQEEVVPPLSSGESSPNASDEENNNKTSSGLNGKNYRKLPSNTSLEDVLSYMVDSSLLIVDKEPPQQRATKADVANSWRGCFELLFQNVNVQMSYSALKRDIKERFKTFQFIRFEKFRTLYYQGKYSWLVTFIGEGAQFVYFNYKTHQRQYRQVLGENLEVYKVNINKLDECGTQQMWVPIILRNIPIHFDRNIVTRLISSLSLTPKNIEEPIILNEKKHCMVVFSDIESALIAIHQLPLKLKDIHHFRVNFHPKFDKHSWKNRDPGENPVFSFYNTSPQTVEKDDTHAYSSKTYQLLHFRKTFMEDVTSINKMFKTLRAEKDDEFKKLSQRSTTPIYHHEKNNENHETFSSNPHHDTPSASFKDFNQPTEHAASDFIALTSSPAKERHGDVQTCQEYSSPKSKTQSDVHRFNRTPEKSSKSRRRTDHDQKQLQQTKSPEDRRMRVGHSCQKGEGKYSTHNIIEGKQRNNNDECMDGEMGKQQQSEKSKMGQHKDNHHKETEGEAEWGLNQEHERNSVHLPSEDFNIDIKEQISKQFMRLGSDRKFPQSYAHAQEAERLPSARKQKNSKGGGTFTFPNEHSQWNKKTKSDSKLDFIEKTENSPSSPRKRSSRVSPSESPDSQQHEKKQSPINNGHHLSHQNLSDKKRIERGDQNGSHMGSHQNKGNKTTSGEGYNNYRNQSSKEPIRTRSRSNSTKRYSNQVKVPNEKTGKTSNPSQQYGNKYNNNSTTYRIANQFHRSNYNSNFETYPNRRRSTSAASHSPSSPRRSSSQNRRGQESSPVSKQARQNAMPSQGQSRTPTFSRSQQPQLQALLQQGGNSLRGRIMKRDSMERTGSPSESPSKKNPESNGSKRKGKKGSPSPSPSQSKRHNQMNSNSGYNNSHNTNYSLNSLINMKSPCSEEEGEYDEDNMQGGHQQHYRQRGNGYPRPFKAGRRDPPNNYKKMRNFMQNQLPLERNPREERNPTREERNPTREERNPTREERNSTREERNPTREERNLREEESPYARNMKVKERRSSSSSTRQRNHKYSKKYQRNENNNSPQAYGPQGITYPNGERETRYGNQYSNQRTTAPHKLMGYEERYSNNNNKSTKYGNNPANEASKSRSRSKSYNNRSSNLHKTTSTSKYN